MKTRLLERRFLIFMWAGIATVVIATGTAVISRALPSFEQWQFERRLRQLNLEDTVESVRGFLERKPLGIVKEYRRGAFVGYELGDRLYCVNLTYDEQDAALDPRLESIQAYRLELPALEYRPTSDFAQGLRQRWDENEIWTRDELLMGFLCDFIDNTSGVNRPKYDFEAEVLLSRRRDTTDGG